MFYVDRDDFKGINDTLGQKAGDELLRETARRLHDSRRPADTPAQLGGRQIAVHVSLGVAESTAVIALAADADAERLVSVVAQTAFRPVAVTSDIDGLAGLVETTTPSVVLLDLSLAPSAHVQFAALTGGRLVVPVIALCSDQPPEVLADALAAGVTGFVRRDAGPQQMSAVITAVRSGCPAVAPDLVGAVLAGAAARLRSPETGVASGEERADAVRAAFTAPGALSPVFQPIADLSASGQLGWLALTRFTDAPPEETGLRFAEAEALGLGQELEVAAAGAALAEIDRLPAPVLLFVKASCATIASQALETVIDERSAARLVIELSGVADLQDREAFNDAVDRLRHRGVRFAVDETGAGFGPLDQVLDLSPAFVRLAGGLTRGIDADRTRRALALTVISFATHLGAKVIADQIETAEEFDALRRLGVGYGLGFHIGRPEALPARATAPTAEPEAAAGTDSGPPVGWARFPASQDLGLPSRAQSSFEAASTAVLRLIGQRLPGAMPYIAFLDRRAGVLRVLDVGAHEPPSLEAGTSFPLAESIDELAATGRVPQASPAGSTAVHPPGAATWAVVPFAGSPEAPSATLSAVGDGPPLGDDAVALLRDAAGTLAAALEREQGTDPERVAFALGELAGRDRFTGLLNGHRFREVLAEANARANTSGSPAFVVAASVRDLDGLGERMGQAVRDLVLKDVARSLALEAEHGDALARVGPATYGCVLVGRRSSEVEYFCRSVADRVAADGRRRGATVELRTGAERLGLGANSDDVWQVAVDRVFSG